MKKLYVIRREDIFNAIAANQLPSNQLLQVGSIWAVVELTESERKNYSFPISDY